VQKQMNERKIRTKRTSKTKAASKDVRERLDLIDKDTELKLRTLECVFAATKDHSEEFHQLYIRPLLETGLTLEDSLALLVDGVLHPN
jgi:hypothetical protein